MTRLLRSWTFWYWLAIVALSFGVAYALLQVVELHERADRATARAEALEQTVGFLAGRDTLPSRWSFEIGTDLTLECVRVSSDDDPLYRCTRTEQGD
jgi:hypothetical protein